MGRKQVCGGARGQSVTSMSRAVQAGGGSSHGYVVGMLCLMWSRWHTEPRWVGRTIYNQYVVLVLLICWSSGTFVLQLCKSLHWDAQTQ